jgi:hypothetical protein
MRILTILLISALAFGQNTGNVGNLMETTFAAGAPTGVCTVGKQYFRTDAVAGQNVFICAAVDGTGAWTAQATTFWLDGLPAYGLGTAAVPTTRAYPVMQ